MKTWSTRHDIHSNVFKNLSMVYGLHFKFFHTVKHVPNKNMWLIRKFFEKFEIFLVLLINVLLIKKCARMYGIATFFYNVLMYDSCLLFFIEGMPVGGFNVNSAQLIGNVVNKASGLFSNFKDVSSKMMSSVAGYVFVVVEHLL